MAITKNTAATAAEAAPAPAVVKAAAKTVAKTDAAPAAEKPAKAAVAKAEAKPAVVKKVAAKEEGKVTVGSDVAEKKEPVVKAPPAPTMGRKALAEAVHAKVKEAGKAIPAGLAELAIAKLEEAITEGLATGHDVVLPGFGKFSSVARAETERPNPQKPGEKVTVAAHNAPKFKAGTGLKKALNAGAEVEDGEDASGE